MLEDTPSTQDDEEAKFERLITTVAHGCLRYIATFAFVFIPWRLRRICTGTLPDRRLRPLTFLVFSAFAAVFTFYVAPDAARRGVFAVLQREMTPVSTTTIIFVALPVVLMIVAWTRVCEIVLGLRVRTHHRTSQGASFLSYVAGVQLASLAIVCLVTMAIQEMTSSIASFANGLYLSALLILPSIYAFSCGYAVWQRLGGWRRPVFVLFVTLFIISTPAVALYVAHVPQRIAWYAAQSEARALLDTPVASRLVDAKLNDSRRLVLMFWIKNKTTETLVLETAGRLDFHSITQLKPTGSGVTITGREHPSDPKFFLRPEEATWVELTTQAPFLRHSVDVDYRFWPTFVAHTTTPRVVDDSIEVKLGRRIGDSADVDRRPVCVTVSKLGRLESCGARF